MASHRFLDPELPDPPVPTAEGAVVLGDGRSLGWAEYGDPHGDVIVWFHGTPGGRRQVPPDIDALARERGFRIVAIERPGTGLSTPWPPRRIVDWAADVERATDALGIERFGIAGLSGGGPYVLACASALADRVVGGAVLGGFGPTVGDEPMSSYTSLLRHLEPLLTAVRSPLGELVTYALRPLRSHAYGVLQVYSAIARPAERRALRRPELMAMFIDDICSSAEGGLRAPINDLVLFARDWGFSVRDIDVPIRFWHGDEDGIVPLDHSYQLAALLGHAEVVVVPGEGHFAGFVRGAEVLDWMRAIWPAPARRNGSSRTHA